MARRPTIRGLLLPAKTPALTLLLSARATARQIRVHSLATAAFVRHYSLLPAAFLHWIGDLHNLISIQITFSIRPDLLNSRLNRYPRSTSTAAAMTYVRSRRQTT